MIMSMIIELGWQTNRGLSGYFPTMSFWTYLDSILANLTSMSHGSIWYTCAKGGEVSCPNHHVA